MTDAANPEGAGDLAILHPERAATIAGVALVVREYTFAESLRHQALVSALCDAMTGVALTGEFHDMDSLRAAFGDNADILLRLVAIACDQPLAWVQGLSAIDGEQLFLLWWSVNADFFLRRVLLSVQLHKVRQLDGPTSPASSLPTGMMPAGLATTPSVN
jgi:hypothetical protein